MSNLNEIEVVFKEIHKVNVPKIDIKAIENFAKNQSYEDQDVYQEREVDNWDFFTLGIARLFRKNQIKVGTEKVVNDEKYNSSIITEVTSYIQKTKIDTVNQTKNIVKNYLEDVSNKVNHMINERQVDLKCEKEKSQENEEIIVEIDVLKNKQSNIPNGVKRVNEILEEVSYE
jgi:hypothetical protein